MAKRKREHMLEVRFFDRQEFREREAARMAHFEQAKSLLGDRPVKDLWTPEFTAAQAEFFPPGSLWECPWYFDPLKTTKADRIKRKHFRRLSDAEWQAGPGSFLSMYYWRDHSRERAPYCVRCPNGIDWVVDSGSSNGLGWRVSGQPQRLTCTPSIGAGFSPKGKRPPYLYHGYLTDGWFCPDLDRPDAPRGVRYDGSVA